MHGVEFAGSELEAARDADAVVLVTEWPQFGELDFVEVADAMRGDVVIDGRNALDPERVQGAGLRYEGVGRGRAAGAVEPAAVSGEDAQPATTGAGPG
jgi:UDPglucose 6-dehydrogenase